jgi:high-affinity iron transporter
MTRAVLRQLLLLLLLALGVSTPARAQTAPAQTIWRLLDYIAVDYAGAVSGGRVVNDTEYTEMADFSADVRRRLRRLPPTAARRGLIRGAEALESIIAAKAPPAQVAASARALGRDLLAAYPVPLAPSGPPDLARGAVLYAQNCASCHGDVGNGRGPAAKGMDPPPIDFTDRRRARERSLFALYQVIEQGLEGTAMPSFAHLTPEDRWALAFHAGRFAYPASAIGDGQRLSSQAESRRHVPDLAALVRLTPAQLEGAIGPERATAVTAYLRGRPDGSAESASGSLSLSRERLVQAVDAYGRGDAAAATDLALSAYLDGFEPVEPLLSARDGDLMRRIETAMAELRSAISRRAPIAEVQARADELNRLFGDAERVIAPEAGSTVSAFLGAFAILLREGLEALLIVIAMIAFLRKAERQDVMVYVHGGWIVALLAGIATWAAATYVIGVSGASRELTEGFGSLLAAAVLLTVGVWMHGKAQAGAWQRYVAEKLTKVLSKRSAWFLFGLTFIVVYREVFETIIFYATLWSQENYGAILAGAGAGVALLVVIAVAMLRFSRHLPISDFFRYSSILIAMLAVILTGKGVAGLQEAGLVGSFPRIDILGFLPTAETLLAQLAVLAATLIGFRRNRIVAAKLKSAAAGLE